MEQPSQAGRRFGGTTVRWIATGLLALLAAVLRFRGLSWGEPYVYHPDEHNIVYSALGMVRERSLDPDFFHYPSLLLYLQAVVSALLQLWIHADLRTDPAVHGLGPWDVAPEQFPFVLAGRALVATTGVASVAAVTVLWWRWFGWVAALVAGALLAVSPLHVESSHYLTTDVLAMLWVLLAVFWSVHAGENISALALASFFAGLAASTKYPAGVVWFLVLAAVAAKERPFRAALLSAVIFAAAFALTSPFVVLRPQRVWEDLSVVRHNYASGAWSPWNFWFYLSYLWHVGLGPVGCGLALLGWVWLWFARDMGNRWWRAAVAVLPWVYVAYVSSWSVRYERNLMPMLPLALLFGGLALSKLLQQATSLRARAAVAALLVAVTWTPLRSSQALVRSLSSPDTRSLALQWIESNIPAGAHIAREEYTPQVSGKRYRVTYVQVLGTRPYAWYLGSEVDYLVASSLIYERYRDHPTLGEFYRFAFERLPLVAEFRPEANTTGPTVRILHVPRWRPEEE
ncbi:hypothetical protein HRbin30_00646 [bacterium HR30]|nr:hypothetical protein HRbin30_00646 [bacterium HR30]